MDHTFWVVMWSGRPQDIVASDPAMTEREVMDWWLDLQAETRELPRSYFEGCFLEKKPVTYIPK